MKNLIRKTCTLINILLGLINVLFLYHKKMKKIFSTLIIFLLFTSSIFAADEIEKGKTLLKSLSKKSLTKKETISFLKENAVIVEDERGDGRVTYIFDDEKYSRYKGTEIISTDAWRFSKLGALRLFNKDIKMTWKIKISDKENLINIKTKFDPVGKLYEFEVKTKKEFLDQIEQIKQAEIQKKEAIEKAKIEKQKKLEQEKLVEEQKRKEEERKLEEERLAAEQKLEEEKRKLEEERLATEQKLKEEKRKLEEEKLALQKELEELKKKKSEELKQNKKTPAQIKKEEREKKKKEKLAADKKAKEEKERLKQEKLAAQKKAEEEEERLKQEKLAEQQKTEEKKYYWGGKEVSKEEHDRLLNDLKRRAEKNQKEYNKKKAAEQKLKNENNKRNVDNWNKIVNAAYESKMCIFSLGHPDLNFYKNRLLSEHEFVATQVLIAKNNGATYFDSYISDFRALHRKAMTTATSNCKPFPY